MIFLYSLSIFFAFFPYISFIYTGTDIQPYSLMINIIVFLLIVISGKLKKINKYNIILFIPVLLSLVLILFSTNKFAGLRSLYGYLNIAISLQVYIFIMLYNEKLFLKFLKFSIYAWTIIGFIQLIINRKFLFFLLPRHENTINIYDISRGVNSLAPEPTFYAIVSLFLILITLTIPDNKLKNKNILISLLLFSIIFISKSSMVILFLFIYIIMYLIINFLSLRTISLFGVFFLILILTTKYLIDFKSLEHTRAYKLFQLALEHPFEVAKIDASMNDRISAVFFSIKGTLETWFMPHTYGEYSEYLLQEVPKSSYFWYITINDRIKSFSGSILFELGIFGIFIFINIFYLLYRYHRRKKKDFLLYLVFINMILLSAIQLSFSLIPMYLASLYVYGSKAYRR